MARWRCNCPICRLLVHPVLRRLGAVGEASGPAVPRREVRAVPLGGEETEVTPLAGGVAAEEAEETSAQVASSPKEAAPLLDEELLEGFASKISASIREVVEGSNKVLLERLDRIEENVGKLRKEIKDLVAGMENVIVEFREALNELNNPLFAAPAQGHVPAQFPVGGAGENIAALIQGLGELVQKVGLDTVTEIIDEYVKAGLLTDEEAKKLKAIAKTIARLGGKADPRLVAAIIVGARQG